MRVWLKDKDPMSPVSVEVFNMPRTAALENMSFDGAAPCGGAPRLEREAPVIADTLLDLLLRPLMLDTASVKGIVPPDGACC